MQIYRLTSPAHTLEAAITCHHDSGYRMQVQAYILDWLFWCWQAGGDLVCSGDDVLHILLTQSPCVFLFPAFQRLRSPGCWVIDFCQWDDFALRSRAWHLWPANEVVYYILHLAPRHCFSKVTSFWWRYEKDYIFFSNMRLESEGC